MLKDITLGQYYQTDSVIHRLDPRVKLVATLAFIVSLFIVNSFWGYLIAAAFLVVMIRLSHVPFKFMVRGMKAIVFLLVVAGVFNLFLTPGEVVVAFWKLKITKEGIKQALLMAARLCFLIIWIFHYDTDYYSESVDGCNGKAARTVKENSCTGS